MAWRREMKVVIVVIARGKVQRSLREEIMRLERDWPLAPSKLQREIRHARLSSGGEP